MNWDELGNDYEFELVLGDDGRHPGQRFGPGPAPADQGHRPVGRRRTDRGLAVAEAAGCLTREIRALPSVRRAAEEEQRHRWPLCVPVASNATSPAMTEWLTPDQPYARNCITPLDEETAERKWAEGGWICSRARAGEVNTSC